MTLQSLPVLLYCSSVLPMTAWFFGAIDGVRAMIVAACIFVPGLILGIAN